MSHCRRAEYRLVDSYLVATRRNSKLTHDNDHWPYRGIENRHLRVAILMTVTRKQLVDGKHFRELAPCSQQSSADWNAAHRDCSSPAQGERAGEYDRGLCNGEQRNTKQDILQPSYEEIMDQIYAIRI